MNWDKIDDKERVRLVLQHVMGYFVLDETATGWRTPDFAKGLHAPAGFHWPIAFWNTDGECWMTRDIATDVTFFDPLHDLNDAWRVIARLGLHLIGFEYAFYKRTDRYGENVWLWECRFDYNKKRISSSAQQPAEAVCIAALKAVEI